MTEPPASRDSAWKGTWRCSRRQGVMAALDVTPLSQRSHTCRTPPRSAAAMSGSAPRRALGAAGERLARTHLEARGLAILDANFRTRHGELDIVAADARCLVFCEV